MPLRRLEQGSSFEPPQSRPEEIGRAPEFKFEYETLSIVDIANRYAWDYDMHKMGEETSNEKLTNTAVSAMREKERAVADRLRDRPDFAAEVLDALINHGNYPPDRQLGEAVQRLLEEDANSQEERTE